MFAFVSKLDAFGNSLKRKDNHCGNLSLSDETLARLM